MSELIGRLDALGADTLKAIEAASSLETLEATRVSVLGKKGGLSEILRGLGSVGPDERPKIGAAANEWKRRIEEALDSRGQVLQAAELSKKLLSEKTDVTLPPRLAHRGALHPISQTQNLILRTFQRIGFEVVSGPEVETEYLNFDAINTPKDHPARDMQDTFFIGPGVVLRTHTSPVQMRKMLSQKPPVRVLCPGAVFRCDDDATHSPMFHQIEGLWVDRDVRMSDLKGVLEFFAKEIFGSDVQIRMRPSFFPFVEPGAEVDVSCFQCRKGPRPECRICKGTGWFEILGAGMVHPNLFKAAGYPAGQWTGFAFGLGVDRIAMLLHEIPHIKHLYQSDVRFLGQF